MKVKGGVYLITDPKFSQNQVLSALNGDVKYLQIRNKDKKTKEFYQEALFYRKVTTERKIPLIINDRLDVALAVNADGLHIGQSDLPLDICRKLLPDKIIGVSVSNLKEAQIAQMNGADYLGVGAIFATDTKSDAKVIGIEELAKIIRISKIPVVAIGGITLQNVETLIEVGTTTVAVISDILASDNPELQVDKYAEKFKGNV